MAKHIVPIALATFSIGCFVGLLVGRSIGERNEQTKLQAPVSHDYSHPEGSSVVKAVEVKNSQEADEIARLRTQVQDLAARVQTATRMEDKFQFAREIYEGLTTPIATAEEAERGLRFSILAGDLKPDMAPYFINKLNDPAHQKNRDKLLKLVLACAGPPAAGVLKDYLRTPIRAVEENNAVTEALLGAGYGHRTEPVIPVDSELRALGEQKLSSTDALERTLGIGVLAQDPTDTSRGRLQGLVQSDGDERVRLAAIRALALVGDRATLLFFEGLIGGVPQEWPLEKPVATPEDRKNFYVTEAYDHIKERVGNK